MPVFFLRGCSHIRVFPARLRRKKNFMTSSTTQSNGETMQIIHCSPLSDVVPKKRCKNPDSAAKKVINSARP